MSVTFLLLVLGGDYFKMGRKLPISCEILKNLRKKEKYTQKYVAEQLGVEVKTYRSWEIGYYKDNIQMFPTIDSEKLIKISDLYNVSIDYILGRSNITQVDNTYIHAKIGLSENSIFALEKAKNDQFTVYSSYIIEIIDFLLNHDETKELIRNLYYYFFVNFDYLEIFRKYLVHFALFPFLVFLQNFHLMIFSIFLLLQLFEK